MHRKNLEKAKEVAEEAVEKNKLRQLLEKLKMLGKKSKAI